MKCITCNKELEENRTKPQKFCSDRCRKVYSRIKDNGQDNGQIEITDRENGQQWIPNWKRVGFKTREDSFVELTRIIGQLGGRWWFQGFKFDLPLRKSNSR